MRPACESALSREDGRLGGGLSTGDSGRGETEAPGSLGGPARDVEAGGGAAGADSMEAPVGETGAGEVSSGEVLRESVEEDGLVKASGRPETMRAASPFFAAAISEENAWVTRADTSDSSALAREEFNVVIGDGHGGRVCRSGPEFPS